MPSIESEVSLHHTMTRSNFFAEDMCHDITCVSDIIGNGLSQFQCRVNRRKYAKYNHIEPDTSRRVDETGLPLGMIAPFRSIAA